MKKTNKNEIPAILSVQNFVKYSECNLASNMTCSGTINKMLPVNLII